MSAQSVLQRLTAREIGVCLACNRLARRQTVQGLFARISRLGDGFFWYVLMASLPVLHGAAGLRTTLEMGVSGLLSLALYSRLKGTTLRQRPFQVNAQIHLGTHPLDEYSFPSGHTMHAVSFTLVMLVAFPGWSWLLLPFTALVALSRVILGLHYPSDVLAGAAIGGSIASVVLWASRLLF